MDAKSLKESLEELKHREWLSVEDIEYLRALEAKSTDPVYGIASNAIALLESYESRIADLEKQLADARSSDIYTKYVEAFERVKVLEKAIMSIQEAYKDCPTSLELAERIHDIARAALERKA